MIDNKDDIMVKMKRLIISLMLISCFFILINAASAADFNVKDNTTHKDITDWMKKKAETGDNLIFVGSSYNLTDTIKINKAINVKSSKNTKINFNKNKAMFNIETSSKVTFSGLTLNYDGQGTSEKGIGVIYASKGVKKVNFDRITINSNKSFVAGIEISSLDGNVYNSKINVNGYWGIGLSFVQWKGNLVNSQITTRGNSSISVYSTYWLGKVSRSKIYNYGYSQGAVPAGLLFVFAKGTISKCKVEVPNGGALRLDKNVKVSGSTLKSQKGTPKIYRFIPDLSININNTKRSGNTYYVQVSNSGLGSSNACYLGIKIGNYVKTVKVKALSFGKSTTVKVTLPSKYISKKYVKTVKVDYYNKVKEENKNNNVFQFT